MTYELLTNIFPHGSHAYTYTQCLANHQIYIIYSYTRAHCLYIIHMVFYFKDVLEVGCCVCFYQRTKRLKASRSMDVKSIYLYIRIRKENVYVKCSKSICTFDVFWQTDWNGRATQHRKARISIESKTFVYPESLEIPFTFPFLHNRTSYSQYDGHIILEGAMLFLHFCWQKAKC